MVTRKLPRCLVCDKPTAGSVGAAGIAWARICQPCKDREDKALERRVIETAKAFDGLFGVVAK